MLSAMSDNTSDEAQPEDRKLTLLVGIRIAAISMISRSVSMVAVLIPIHLQIQPIVI